MAAATVGSALAAYTFVGFYSHSASTRRTSRADPRRPRARRVRTVPRWLDRKYRWLTVLTVIGTIVFTESSLFLLVGLALSYCGLISGVMLPRIDWKRSIPHRVFDVIGVAIVADLLFQQLFASSRPTLAGEVPVLDLPPGRFPRSTCSCSCSGSVARGTS